MQPLDMPRLTAGVWRKLAARKRWLRNIAQGTRSVDQRTPLTSPLQSPDVGSRPVWFHNRCHEQVLANQPYQASEPFAGSEGPTRSTPASLHRQVQH